MTNDSYDKNNLFDTLKAFQKHKDYPDQLIVIAPIIETAMQKQHRLHGRLDETVQQTEHRLHGRPGETYQNYWKRRYFEAVADREKRTASEVTVYRERMGFCSLHYDKDIMGVDPNIGPLKILFCPICKKFNM